MHCNTQRSNDVEIVIEKNVPVPSEVERGGKYMQACKAIASMDVGDSFVFPSPSTPSPLYTAAKNSGVKIAVRKIGAQEFRVFRTA
jgi:hypothetical protein